jgi:hypothetical protein
MRPISGEQNPIPTLTWRAVCAWCVRNTSCSVPLCAVRRARCRDSNPLYQEAYQLAKITRFATGFWHTPNTLRYLLTA